MTTYIVKGQNWEREVEIDEDLFDKNMDACIEAATRVIEQHKAFSQHETMGVFLDAYKKKDGYLGSSHCFLKTSEILRNASLYECADWVETLYN